ncbi:proton-conducting transporter transmembrane domain-containing protein [Streptomyces sp. NBC_01465]|uniref:proton-conducting transporter transmembrane domain-containing protein n=1 Tax=Streptomyces sp. NBC_01465 TaxID=2903878 RepID=UPI002E3097A4|nr:proton-conducting transporter membrane subunit [Streptomyces sp. NBC_01465]
MSRLGSALCSTVTAAVGAAGLVGGATALGGGVWSADVPWLLPLGGVRLALDPLGGLFMAVSGAVVLAVAVYGIGWAGTSAALPGFAVALVLVPAAASVSSFLLLWELMALTSLLLVITEHRERPRAVREAGVWYAVMTQLGFVLLLAGLALFASRAGGESFAALRAGAGAMPGAVRGVVFVLVAAACMSKSGLVPLHGWLPRAYGEAPGPVSALMSAAMVNMGVYGLVRVGFDLLGGGPVWWWLLVVAAAGVSAVYGILQAAMASDLKRLLAYSSTENMGLVLLGVGAAGLFAAAGDRQLAGLALAAALLHVVNHAAFKGLLFCAAGAVVRASGGVRDLDALGGLRARMPVTAGLFALAALGAVALPPGNGFVSEWLLLQALIHGFAVPGIAAAIVLPLAVAVIALSAGLAAAVFVKALGVGFFARARGAGAVAAVEAPPFALAGMGLFGAACVGLALAPGVLGGGLDRAVGVAGTAAGGPLDGGGVDVRLEAIGAHLSPVVVAFAVAAALVVTAGAVRVLARRRRRTRARVWDCGGGAPTPSMAYTATSFAEPLQRVFDQVLAPEQDVEETAVSESAYLVERIRFRRRVPDRIEHRLYRPVLETLERTGRAARRLATGSVHLYLGYGFFGLVSLLVVLAVGW